MYRIEISKIKFSGEQFSNTLLAYVEETDNLLAAIENSSRTKHSNYVHEIESILAELISLSDDIRDATEKEVERLERMQEIRKRMKGRRVVKDSPDDIIDATEKEVERLERKQRIRKKMDSMRAVKDSADDIKDVTEEEVVRVERKPQIRKKTSHLWAVKDSADDIKGATEEEVERLEGNE